jgi:hypothetical protein
MNLNPFPGFAERVQPFSSTFRRLFSLMKGGCRILGIGNREISLTAYAWLGAVKSGPGHCSFSAQLPVCITSSVSHRDPLKISLD